MNHTTNRRVALVADAAMHLGPDLARVLARRGHDLVLAEPAPGLAQEVEDLGASVAMIEGPGDDSLDLSESTAVASLVDCALDRFGRLDAACIRTGRIRGGATLDVSAEDLRSQVSDNVESVLFALQALLPPMLEAGSGQIVIVTSAAGEYPVIQAPLYSATRAAANMLVRTTALAHADSGVTINAIGTNYLDYPGFRRATGADDPDVRARIESQVPMRRLGSPDEVAHFCAALLDGTSRFQTGQFFPAAGGWRA